MDSTDLTLLLERCRRDEPGAWASLVENYAGLVYAIARSHRLDESTCDDVAQSVFAALHRRLHAIREPAALPGWIKTSTLRECWRAARSKPAVELTRDLPEPPPAPTLERIETAQKVREALELLGGRCRDLLYRLFLADTRLDYVQAAQDLGMPIGGIGPMRRRCLDKLGKILGQSDNPTQIPGPTRI